MEGLTHFFVFDKLSNTKATLPISLCHFGFARLRLPTEKNTNGFIFEVLFIHKMRFMCYLFIRLNSPRMSNLVFLVQTENQEILSPHRSNITAQLALMTRFRTIPESFFRSVFFCWIATIYRK